MRGLPHVLVVVVIRRPVTGSVTGTRRQTLGLDLFMVCLKNSERLFAGTSRTAFPAHGHFHRNLAQLSATKKRSVDVGSATGQRLRGTTRRSSTGAMASVPADHDHRCS